MEILPTSPISASSALFSPLGIGIADKVFEGGRQTMSLVQTLDGFNWPTLFLLRFGAFLAGIDVPDVPPKAEGRMRCTCVWLIIMQN